MDCREINEQDLAEQYVSQRLTGDLRDQLEIHMLDCPDCLTRIEALRAAGRILAEQAQDIRLGASRPARWSFLAWTALAASLVVVLWLGLYRLERRNPRSTEKSIYTATASPPPPAIEQSRPSERPAVSSSPKRTVPQQHQASEGQQHAAPMQAGKKQDDAALSAPAPADSKLTRTATSHPDTTTARRSGPPPMSEEAAVELYWLGVVQPPPYTFAGFGASVKPPRSKEDVETITSPGVPMGSDRALFQEGMIAYVEGSYGKAAEILENALRTEPTAADVNFYLGISRLLSGHPADSISPLKSALAAPMSPLTQPAHFYLAKAYVQLNKLPEAQDEMQAAAALPGRLRAEARSLVARIEALRKKLSTPSSSQAPPSN